MIISEFKVILDKTPLKSASDMILENYCGIKYRVAIEHVECQPGKGGDKYVERLGEYYISFYPEYNGKYSTRTQMKYYLSTIYKKEKVRDHGLCLDDSTNIYYGLSVSDLEKVDCFIVNFISEFSANMGSEWNERN